MIEGIKDQVTDELKAVGLFALQLDESSGLSCCSQLFAFVWYCQYNVFMDESVCHIDPSSTTCGEDLCQAIDAYFGASDIKWEWLYMWCSSHIGHTLWYKERVKVAGGALYIHIPYDSLWATGYQDAVSWAYDSLWATGYQDAVSWAYGSLWATGYQDAVSWQRSSR